MSSLFLGLACALAVWGLAAIAYGAWSAGQAALLSEAEAIEIGISRLSAETYAENLSLPGVQALLRQSGGVRTGLYWIAGGTGLLLASLAALIIERLCA